MIKESFTFPSSGAQPEISPEADATVLQHNLYMLEGRSLYRALNGESMGGNAGGWRSADGRSAPCAGVWGYADGAGRIMAFGNFQDLPLRTAEAVSDATQFIFRIAMVISQQEGMPAVDTPIVGLDFNSEPPEPVSVALVMAAEAYNRNDAQRARLMGIESVAQ